MPFATAYYKAVMKAVFQDQAIVNILWYRPGLNFDLTGLGDGGTTVLAGLVKDNVWPKLKALMNTTFTMEEVVAYHYDQSLHLSTQLPGAVPVGETGARGTGNGNGGPAPCAILRFNLAPTSVLDNFFPPKRGYLAVGPLDDDEVTDDGHVNTTSGSYNAEWGNLADAVSSNLVSIVPPLEFVPIRIQTKKIAGLITLRGHADIVSAVVRSRASFRRSRLPEV